MRACVGVVILLAACGGNGGAAGDDACAGTVCGAECCAPVTQACIQNATTAAEACTPTCTKQSDCASGCCAPLADAAGNLIGPFVCQDSSACCYTGICPGASCCVTDPNGNEFCADECTGASQCAGGATCQDYSFTHSLCDGPMACGPAGD
jgi:hypothetical protein